MERPNDIAEAEAANLAAGTLAPRKRARRVITKAPAAKVTPAGSVVVVQDAPSPVDSAELRKAVEAITVRNTSSSGEISLIQRKAYNAMLQIAQKNRTGDEITFEVPISELESLVGHTNSNNREYLKQMARQLMDIKVEFDFKGESAGRKSAWGIANMVAEVYISDDGQRIKWSFPPELAKRLLNPEVYNRIDMRMQNVFTSGSALTLYETVSRYYGFELRETFREHWTAWSVILSGAPKPHAQFRDFNKMLMRAMEQVNAHETRFSIELHLSKRGRKIDKLWFVLKEKEQSQLPLESQATMVSELVMKSLMTLGLTDNEITLLAMEHDEDYLLAQAEFTSKRMSKSGMDPITHPKGFFQSAVENNYADAPRRSLQKRESPAHKLLTAPTAKPRAKSKPDIKRTLDTMKEAWRAAKIKEIEEKFQAQDSAKRAKIIDDIKQDLSANTVIWDQYRKKGLSKLVLKTVYEIIMKKNVPEPSAEDLLQFALETGSLQTVAAA
ncbi:replication initiation protein [Cupriavidus basilensis]|uniref:replication initiation protein n=1 Tax=Cupriavidus basilensis TaxID=68895 RepID=UPI0020A6C965|nr:replication initiation protein [Cupriavidus basilensis]MCP3018291.1 replication initiation protein [Cupriavidus basilensis]